VRIEHWWLIARLRLRSILFRRRVEAELEEELQFHLDRKTEEGIANGLSPREARYVAMRAMNGLEQRKEEMRDMRHVRWLTDFADDARYAMRSLRRSPGLAVFVTAALALGIGMPSATYSMLDALIFRPYPVPHPDGVVTLASTTHDRQLNNFSYREYLDIRDQSTTYAGVIASTDMRAVGFSAQAGALPRVRGGMLVSGNYFRVLGVEPQLGRGFRDDEDQVPGRAAVAVLGPNFWRHQFGSDPSVVGRKIRLNGTTFTVIGVAPDTFQGMLTFGNPDVYVPLAMAREFFVDAGKDFFDDRDHRTLRVRARLGSGATLQEARHEIGALARNFERDYPKVNRGRGATVYTRTEERTLEDGNWRFGVIFLMLALAVLAVACTNVAGLLLSRGRARRREIAVRLAIGAGRVRLVRLLLTESLLLASLGGLGGIAVGYGIIEWFQSKRDVIFMTDLPVGVPFRMDTRVLLAALALSGLSALLCGLLPALQNSRADLVTGLKSADLDLPGRKRLWGRNVLVVAQVSTSLMLMTAAFLMARSFQHSLLDGTGFAKDRLLMTAFDTRLAQYNAARSRQFYEQLVERAEQMPGVVSTTLTQTVPLGADGSDSLAFVPDGFPMPPERDNFVSRMNRVDEGYFESIGIPIVRGRAFLRSDTADAVRVAVVNEQFAKHYWPKGDALGKRIRLDGPTGVPVEIVGVAQTIKYLSTTEKPRDFVYLPFSQHPVARMYLMLRSSGDPLQLVPPLKDIVRALDSNLPMLQTMAYEDFYLNTAVRGPRIAIHLVRAMGAVGLVLTLAGLYGLVSYNASRRTREFGIRIAIGAGRSHVLRLVMGKGLLLVGLGTAVGLAMSLAVEQFMNSMVFNAGGVDLVAYAIVAPSLFVITTLAAYVPARRASRIAPTQALRYE
jgi:predicted permease